MTTGPLRMKRLILLVLLGGLGGLMIGAARHQHPSQSSAPLSVMWAQKGTVVAQGPAPALPQSAGNPQLKRDNAIDSYQLEQVTVDRPLSFLGSDDEIDRVWRLTVFGYFPIGAQGWQLYLDSTALPTQQGRTQLTGMVYDPQLVKNGAVIGVTYGAANQYPAIENLDSRSTPKFMLQLQTTR